MVFVVTPAALATLVIGLASYPSARMSKATVKVYPGGHFDPYVDPLFARVVADQLAFLNTHVPV
jgi:uncharacterized protein